MRRTFDLFWQRCVSISDPTRIAYYMLAAGIALRLKYYLENLSLWLDEAALVLEILRRSFSEIFFVLNYNEFSPTAPIGFLLLEKGVLGAWGEAEWALRFVPLAFSILSVILFSRIVRRQTRPLAGLVALSIFALAGPLIYYSAQVKPYASDVLVAIVLFEVCDYVRRAELNMGRALLLGAAGAIALWFSYGAIFVVAGSLGSMIVMSMVRRQPERRRWLYLAACLTALSFVGLYVNDFSQIRQNSRLYGMWREAFAPWPLWSTETIVWLKDAFLNMFSGTLGVSGGYVTAGLFIVGAVSVLRRDREKGLLLIAPLLAVLLAAMAHQYPFSGRLLLFLAFSLALLVGEGLQWVAERFPKYSTALIILLSAAVLAQPVKNAVDVVGRGHAFEEMRPIARYLKERHQPRDAVYLNNSAQYAYGYYSGYFGVNIQTPFVGVFFDVLNPGLTLDLTRHVRYINYIRTPQGFLVGQHLGKKIDALLENHWGQVRHNPRTWLIFSHALEPCRAAALDAFNREGRKLDEFHSRGASIYLYDMSGRDEGR